MLLDIETIRGLNHWRSAELDMQGIRALNHWRSVDLDSLSHWMNVGLDILLIMYFEPLDECGT